jgi:diguanylate cyclase (GGDEF)-like protein/PAS domain S-box-containing protein
VGLASEARWVGGIVSDITDRKGAELDLIESRRQLSTLIDNLPGIAYRCTVGAPWRMTYISEGVERLTGYGSAEVMALAGGWCALIHPDDGQAVEAEVAAGIAGRRMFSMSYRILARDGSVRWVLERGRAAYGEAGEAKFLEGFIGDITEQKQIEQSLLEAQHAAERAAERVRQVLENTGDCVYSLDSEWRFTYLNRRARAYFGAGARVGVPLLDVVPGSDDSVFRPVFQKAMSAGRPARLEGYLPSREAWYDLSVAPSEGGVTVFFRDITERKRTEEQVRWLANHDNLTQLPNRLLFQERLDALIAGGAAPGSFALLVVDVDEFKLVNDTLGHDAGDALLCTVADRLRAAARAGDLVARLGGDEFAIILHRVGGEGETEAAVERILAAMREPQVHAGKLLDCSASIGAALYPGPGTERSTRRRRRDGAIASSSARRCAARCRAGCR